MCLYKFLFTCTIPCVLYQSYLICLSLLPSAPPHRRKAGMLQKGKRSKADVSIRHRGAGPAKKQASWAKLSVKLTWAPVKKRGNDKALPQTSGAVLSALFLTKSKRNWRPTTRWAASLWSPRCPTCQWWRRQFGWCEFGEAEKHGWRWQCCNVDFFLKIIFFNSYFKNSLTNFFIFNYFGCANVPSMTKSCCRATHVGMARSTSISYEKPCHVTLVNDGIVLSCQRK